MARRSRRVSKNETVKEQQNTKEPLYHTAIYVRLSVADNGKNSDKANGRDNGDAMANQIAFLENYIKLKPYLQLAGIYSDNGYTGTDFSRPAWNRLIQDVKQGNVNCILVKDLSRLGRDYMEVGDYLEHIFPLLGVRFISVNDCYDSNSPDAMKEGFIIAFKNMIHAYYAKEISKKVALSLHRKQMKGEYQGAHPPYGYQYQEGNTGKLIIDKVTAPVVQQIFHLAKSGYSDRAIVNFLNDKGIPSPRTYFYQLGYYHSNKYEKVTPWVISTVKRIKENQVYLGHMVRGKSEKCLYKNIQKHTVPKDHWIIIENTQEAIISKELFQQVCKKDKAD